MDEELEIGEALDALRVRQGVTIRELAERLNTDLGHVSRCLRGKRNMTLQTMRAFAEALGYELVVSFKPKRTRK